MRGLLRFCRTFAVVAASVAIPVGLAGQAGSDATTRAAAHLQAGEWAEAVAAYRTVVAAAPDDGLSWLRLGRALVEVGEPADALQAFDRASEVGLQTPFLHVFAARAFVRLGRDREALEALETIQPSPAVGGGATLTAITDFAGFASEPRFLAVVAALEEAAWPCRENAESRQFDFWIGEWDVFVGGQQAGTNTVERMLGGCTLLENWTNVRGREGKSFNWVDRASFRDARWRQLWVDDSGNTLDYYGGRYLDEAMRFEGHTFTPQNDSIPQKLTFHNVHADTVRQVFEQSNDGGATWVVTFDGIYIRRR